MTTAGKLPLGVRLREERERQAFAGLAAAGRAAVSDAELILPDRVFERLLGARPGAADPLEQMFSWAEPRAGARVLEICCFDGEDGVVLARGGAHVTSIDLCAELVESARRRAEVNGVADRMQAMVMSAHDLRFAEGSFDIVFGKASLHHLDLELARREILRVLRPGGIGVFMEPISLSPWLGAVRAAVPVAPDRDSPDERQLDAAFLDRFTSAFARTELAYFRLLGRLARLSPALDQGLKHIDRRLLARVPALHRYAGICVFRVRKAGARA
jgi:SAM-dependent methyltransferase